MLRKKIVAYPWWQRMATPSASALSRIWWCALLIAWLPAVRWISLIATENLGANPVEFLTRSTGLWTLVLLMVTLTVTPLRRLLGWPWLIRLRRMLGLTCFSYALVHLGCYAWLDLGLDFEGILADVMKRPFITFGVISMVMLLPLGLTSTHAAMRALGGRRWQQLHRLVYLIGLTSVVHFWLHRAGKNNIDEPAAYAAVLATLLGARWVSWRKTGRL